MKLSEVYLNAAVQVFGSCKHQPTGSGLGFYQHNVACHAISARAHSLQLDVAHTAFAKVFKPQNRVAHQVWFGEALLPYTPEDQQTQAKLCEKNKDHRIFALLFMSELAKDAKL